jgi:chorismate mutase/prephenate dehydratase
MKSKKKTGKKPVGRASARQTGVELKPDYKSPVSHSRLDSIRDRIDDIAKRIPRLLNERAQFAQQVGKSSSSEGLSTADFYKPEREAQVLRKALERNKGTSAQRRDRALFARSCLRAFAQQEPLKVAFLGPRRSRFRSRRC